MNATIDLNKVSVFAKVVETGSFTSAATILGLPKSSVSRSVAHLEESLGVPLLRRTTRSVTLTDAGQRYYERVTGALTAFDEARAAAEDAHASAEGLVRITAPVDLGTWLLADAVSRLVRKYPKLKVDVVLTPRLVDLDKEGVDLGLRVGPVRDERLVAKKLGTADGGLFASSQYAKRRGLPRTVRELERHDCLVFRPHGGAGEWLLRGPDGPHTVNVQGSITADDFSFIRRVVLEGGGIGIFPEFFCIQEIERKKLVRVLPKYALPGPPVRLVHSAMRYVPQRVLLVRDFLMTQFEAQSRPCTR